MTTWSQEQDSLKALQEIGRQQKFANMLKVLELSGKVPEATRDAALSYIEREVSRG